MNLIQQAIFLRFDRFGPVVLELPRVRGQARKRSAVIKEGLPGKEMSTAGGLGLLAMQAQMLPAIAKLERADHLLTQYSSLWS